MASWFKCEICHFGSGQLGAFYKHAMEHFVDPDAEIGASLRNIQQLSQVTGKEMSDVLKNPSILENLIHEDECTMRGPEIQGFSRNIETSPEGPATVQLPTVNNSFLINHLLKSPVKCPLETATERIVADLLSPPVDLYQGMMAGFESYNQTPIPFYLNQTVPSKIRRTKKKEIFNSLKQKEIQDFADLLSHITANVNQFDPKNCQPNMIDELILASLCVGPIPDWHWFFSMRSRYIYENVSHWCSLFPIDLKNFENLQKQNNLADNKKFKVPRKRIRKPVRKVETAAQTASAVRSVVADLVILTEALLSPSSVPTPVPHQVSHSGGRKSTGVKSPLEKISSMLEKDNKLWKNPPFTEFSEDPKTFIWPMPCPVCSEVLVGVESYNSHLDRHVFEKFMNV